MTQEQQEQLNPEDHSFFLAHGEIEECPDGFCPVSNLPVDDDLIDDSSVDWFKKIEDPIDEDYIKAHKLFDL